MIKKEDHPKFLQITSVSSIISGMMAKLICHPIDTLKTKIQFSEIPIQRNQLRNITIKTIQQEGFKGLYQGIGISFFGLIPAMSMYFSVYEWGKKNLNIQGSDLKFFMSGLLAEAVSCIFWLPMDIVKERLQVESQTNMGYKGSWNTLKQIKYQEGILGLYRAYWATVASFGPFSAIYFMVYERMKNLFDIENPNFYSAVMFSSVSGCVASILTNPLEISKLRMQIQRGKIARGQIGFGYKNLLHGVYQIYKNESFLSLYKGAFTRCLYHTPYTALTMGFLESIRNQLLNIF